MYHPFAAVTALARTSRVATSAGVLCCDCVLCASPTAGLTTATKLKHTTLTCQTHHSQHVISFLTHNKHFANHVNTTKHQRHHETKTINTTDNHTYPPTTTSIYHHTSTTTISINKIPKQQLIYYHKLRTIGSRIHK